MQCLALLVFLLGFLSPIFADRRNVDNVESFLAALRDPVVSHITVRESLRLRPFNDWNAYEDLHLDRSVVIEGALGTSNRIVLDMGILNDIQSAPQKPLTPTQHRVTLRNLYITGLPYSTPRGQSEAIPSSLRIENCVLEIFDYDSSTDVHWLRLVDIPRPQTNDSDNTITPKQKIRPTTRDFCSEWCRVYCMEAKYVFLQDVVYSTVELSDISLQSNATVELKNSMLVIPTVSRHIVNTTRSFKNALKDRSGHMTEILIDQQVDIYQWELACPIVLKRNVLIRGRRQSYPPLDLLNFRFSIGCLHVTHGYSVIFRDLLFNNTMFDSPLFPIEVGWQTLVPLLDLYPGAQLHLDNVVLDITIDEDVDIKSRDLLEYFHEQDMSTINGYQLPRYDLEGTLVTRNWCVREYIASSSECFTTINCNTLSRCPNGALYVHSVTYQFPNNPVLQAAYRISNSLLRIQRIKSEFSTQSLQRRNNSAKGAQSNSNKPSSVLIIILISCLSVLALLILCALLLFTRLRLPAKPNCSETVEHDSLGINKNGGDQHGEQTSSSSSPEIVHTDAVLQGTSGRMQKRAERLLGKITLSFLIGEGGFGKVYKGTWNSAIVAVKVMMISDNATSRIKHQGVEREIQVFSKLRHPNIVNLYQSATRKPTRSGSIDGIEGESQSSGSGQRTSISRTEEADFIGSSIETWIVMEYCDRGTLSEAIKNKIFFLDPQQTQVNMKWAILTCREIAAGFEYLHDNHTIHGDLKPHNILLSTSSNDQRHFTAKVTDFGLSRQVVGSCIYTGTVGTMQYMAPEQLESGRLSEKSDVYAFGLIMWQIVSGRSPFNNLTMGDVYRRVVVKKWRPQFDDNIADGYACLAKKCWSHVPDDRPTFHQIRETLEKMENALSQTINIP